MRRTLTSSQDVNYRCLSNSCLVLLGCNLLIQWAVAARLLCMTGRQQHYPRGLNSSNRHCNLYVLFQKSLDIQAHISFSLLIRLLGRNIDAMGLDVLYHLVKVAALVVDVEVELQTRRAHGVVLGQDGRDVGVAHEAEAQRLEAVVDVHAAGQFVGEEPRVRVPALVEHAQRPGRLADEALLEKRVSTAAKEYRTR